MKVDDQIVYLGVRPMLHIHKKNDVCVFTHDAFLFRQLVICRALFNVQLTFISVVIKR
jgi:hypothetical protein